jgi:hydrogenase maturation factor
MCITRAGRVVDVANGRGKVEFFDGRSLGDVDLSIVEAREGSYVEVFGNMALSVLTPAEARGKKKAWTAVRKAVMKEEGGSSG